MEKMTYRELTDTIAQMADRLNTLDMYLTGVVAILGKEEVLASAKEYAADQAKAVETTLAAQVTAGASDGWLKPIPVSGLKSLIVGYETTAGRPAMRMQIVPEGIAPRDRGNYIGRTVNEEFTVQTPHGPVTTKITEIYEIDEVRRKEVIAERQAKAKPDAEPGDAPPPTIDNREVGVVGTEPNSDDYPV